jgi:hypothetical protein
VNEYVLRARRPGFQLQPTSRPVSIYAGPRLRSKFVAAVGSVIPYRVTMADVGFGAQYRAAWRITDGFYLGLPLEYQRARDATAIGEVNSFRTGVAAWYAIPNKLLPAFEAQLLTAAQDGGFALDQSGGARIMLTLLGDKFSIGGRWTTRADRAYFEVPTSYWEFTIGDLGGLAYWIAGR